MSMVKQYTHRNGFNGESEGCSHVEVKGKNVTVVWEDGRRLECPGIELADVKNFIDMGWWIEKDGTS